MDPLASETRLGPYREADSVRREALAIREAKLDTSDPRVSETREALGLAAAAQGRWEQAERLLTAACEAFAAHRWSVRQARACRARLASLPDQVAPVPGKRR
jgi:hypothetical protein